MRMTRRDVLRIAGTAAPLMPGLILGAGEKDATAKTTAGAIRGAVENGTLVYRGVPYGMDTAKTRFAAPQPPAAWEGVRDCLTWAPRTIQPYTAPPAPRPAAPAEPRPAAAARPRNTYRMPPDLGGESEDCLHLNVWTPALRDGGKRPVLVYFHGGGYTYGTVTSTLYDGNRLSKRGDAVVVTVNGRLNAFGFLYLAELGKGFDDSGMAGQLDLVLALGWIHDNIKEFGGDPSRVMVFGQSGGGGKCSTLMAMPPAKGLFHRVICMSGQLIAGTPRERATERARSVIQQLGLKAGDIDAIRTMPVAQIKEAARAAGGYGPVTDGRSLPHDPFWPEPAAQSLDVPLILGNTHDETRFLGGVPGVDLFALQWEGVVPALKASGTFMQKYQAEDMVAKYREWHPDYAPRDVYFQITTDARVWRAEQVAAEKRAGNKESQKKTWVYQMDWASPAAEGRYKAPHTMDLPFAFDNVAIATGMVGDTPEQQTRAQAMADAVSESYLAFARTGNPNNSHVPKWPNFDLTHRPTMIFDDRVRLEDDPRGNQRKYVEQVPYAPNAG
jgi:para-nitrobenzyl esterase